MNYEDKTLTCEDGGHPFTFLDDQSFHAVKGSTNEPKSCGSCREARYNKRDHGSNQAQPDKYPWYKPIVIKRI